MSGKREKIYSYGCSTNRNRGSTVCPNNNRARMDELDRLVIATTNRSVLTPEAVGYVIQRAHERLSECMKTQTSQRPAQIQQELKPLQRE